MEFAGRTAPASNPTRTIPEERALRQTIREVLEASAGVLAGEAGPPDLAAIDQARTTYRDALDRWAGDRLQAGDPAESVLEGFEAGGELRLLAHAALAVAVDAAAVAGHAVHDPPSPLPHWPAPRAGTGPWLGRVAATLRTHLRPASVWFRNSLRAALALGLAVLLTRITRVEHSFWVVLGTLSVLRSNALGTGRTALLPSSVRSSGSSSRPFSRSPSAPAPWRCGSRCRSLRSWPPTCRPPSLSWSARRRSRCSWSSCSTSSSRKAGGWG